MTKRTPKDDSTRATRTRDASQQRRTQEKQEVRAAILSASSELFLEHGYERFSLRQVAEKIGYSPGTIYLYFKDKDEVLFTIMGDGLTRLHAMLSDASATPDIRERLSAMASAYFRFGLTYPAHYQLMFMQRTDYLVRAQSGDLPPPILAIFAMWRSVVEAGMKAGVLRMGDPVSTSDAFWALLHGTVSIAISMPRFDEKRIRDLTSTVLAMVSHGLHQ